MVAGSRRGAMELTERVPGFDLVVVGRPAGAGGVPLDDHAPTRVGDTLVLTPPDSLRAVTRVDLPADFTRHDLPRLSSHRLDVDEGAGVSAKVRRHIQHYEAAVQASGSSASSAPAEAVPELAGAHRCAPCHESAHGFWSNTAHARAFWTLQNRGKARDLECVPCHVTGHDADAGAAAIFVPQSLQAVQCEVCHGSGARHAEDPRAGTIVRVPERALCTRCHRRPHVPAGWDVERAWRATLGDGHGAATGAGGTR
jgi:hypothetical protein